MDRTRPPDKTNGPKGPIPDNSTYKGVGLFFFKGWANPPPPPPFPMPQPYTDIGPIGLHKGFLGGGESLKMEIAILEIRHLQETRYEMHRWSIAHWVS